MDKLLKQSLVTTILGCGAWGVAAALADDRGPIDTYTDVIGQCSRMEFSEAIRTVFDGISLYAENLREPSYLLGLASQGVHYGGFIGLLSYPIVNIDKAFDHLFERKKDKE